MKYILTIFCLAAMLCSYSQNPKKAVSFSGENWLTKGYVDNEVLKTFQKNFDFAIVYHAWSSWDWGPNYYIIAGKNDALSAWRYVNNRNSIVGKSSDSVPVKIAIDSKKLDSLWSILNVNNIADIRQETEDLYGCKIQDTGISKHQSIKSCSIFDADYNTFYILTAKVHRSFSYYAPSYYEKCCPGLRKERSKILSIIEAYKIIQK